LECAGLKNKDLASKSDPICEVFLKGRMGLLPLGRTEMIKNSLNPKFKKNFEVKFFFEEVQELQIKVYDVDNASASLLDDDFLGQTTCTLGEIIGSRGQRLVRELGDKHLKTGSHGRIAITAEEVSAAANSDVVVTFGGRHLRKMDTFGKSDPYLICHRKKPDGTDLQVFQTEFVKNNLNPDWLPVRTDTATLCNSDPQAPLRISCWDKDRGRSDDEIGNVQTSLQELMDAHAGRREIALRHPKGKSKDVGALLVSSISVVKRPTFFDYLAGGCEINLSVAVDFTASNKPPMQPDSLHFMNPQAYNEYQQALIAVGEILQFYDTDKLFPVFGFGGKLPDGKTSHCFALNGNPANPYCAGVGGVLQAYAQALQNVQLYGPTNFAEIIRTVAATAAQAASNPQEQKYFVQLILTDGEITDINQTIAEIVSASRLPLSIVIVGVGGANFASMRKLDGDEVALASGGTRCERDIVQFVEFRKHQNNGPALAAEVLAEIPGIPHTR